MKLVFVPEPPGQVPLEEDELDQFLKEFAGAKGRARAAQDTATNDGGNLLVAVS